MESLVETSLLGNSHPSAATQDAYYSHAKQLWDFCSLIGAVESKLMLCNKLPANRIVPSIQSSVLIEYIRYRRLEKGAIVNDVNDNVKKDINGKDLLAKGG